MERRPGFRAYSGWQEFQAPAGAASARARLLIGVRAFGYNIHIIHDKTRFGRDATMSVVVPDVSPAGDAPARDYPTLAFEPYIPAATALRELTVLPVGVGAVLGMIFGASSLYLVLKVGMILNWQEELKQRVQR